VTPAERSATLGELKVLFYDLKTVINHGKVREIKFIPLRKLL